MRRVRVISLSGLCAADGGKLDSKPATETPPTAYAVAKIPAEAGVPDGVVDVLTTSTTSEVVNATLEGRRVRKLSFTGYGGRSNSAAQGGRPGHPLLHGTGR